MENSTVSTQGQTTIPVSIRRYLDLKPNQQLAWQVCEDTSGVRYVKISAPSREVIESLKGIAKQTYKKYGGGKQYIAKESASWE